MTAAVPPDMGELRRLEAAATEGPWAIKNADVLDSDGRALAVIQDWDDQRELCDNAALIAALRNAARWLLGQAEAVERVRALCNEAALGQDVVTVAALLAALDGEQ